MSRVKTERDYFAFEEIGPQDWVRKTKSIGTSIVAGIEYDAITATYPNSVTEVYAYRSGGITGTIKASVTVVYTTSSKEDILSVAKT
jgi:hypothetical protein